jgi:hypothetical protein
MVDMSPDDGYGHIPDIVRDNNTLVGCMALRVDPTFSIEKVYLIGMNALALEAQKARNDEAVYADPAVLEKDPEIPLETASGILGMNVPYLRSNIAKGAFPGADEHASKIRLSDVERFIRMRVEATKDYHRRAEQETIERLNRDDF